jgi:hypothetical protein
MRNKINLAVIITAAVFWTAACAPGTIPVLVADMDGFELPSYLPDYYGSSSARVNHEGLSIKHSYRTSDDVIHIVLTGKINNGIPEGLLWNSISNLSPTYPPGAGNFGWPVTDKGFGDYRIGTVSSGENPLTGSLSMGTDGSYVVALGSPDFSSEWVMAAPYSAVVISGLIDAGAKGVTVVTETNDSLNLFSKTYREDNIHSSYADFVFRTYSNGRLQKENRYNYDPNWFMQSGIVGADRGGYAFLISKKANPQTAFFEIEYQNGTKKRIEVDYGAVELRQEVHLGGGTSGVLPPGSMGVWFQDPTPANEAAGTYSITGSSDYDYAVTVYAGSIAVTKAGGTPDQPLYLRPFYDPPSIDPSKAATNMIKEIYLSDSNGRRLGRRVGDLVLDWDDSVQAITLNINGYSAGAVEYAGTFYINAVLRYPILISDTESVDKLTCEVTIEDQ